MLSALQNPKCSPLPKLHPHLRVVLLQRETGSLNRVLRLGCLDDVLHAYERHRLSRVLQLATAIRSWQALPV
jgi:hypothetical protein